MCSVVHEHSEMSWTLSPRGGRVGAKGRPGIVDVTTWLSMVH